MSNDKSTEKRILDAARRVFVKRGMAGARMQEIADEANINKAMLHYYFRTKDKLFEAVFKEAIQKIFPSIFSILNADEPLEKKLKTFCDKYISLLLEHPYLPIFIINELNTRPDRLLSILREKGLSKPMTLMRQLKHLESSDSENAIQAEHVLVNVIGLAAFPFIAAPMLKELLQYSDETYRHFLEERKQQVYHFLLQALRLR